MDWIELVVHTTTAAADAVSDALIAEGAQGTMVEDRADIPAPTEYGQHWELIDPSLIETMPEDVLVHAWLKPDGSLAEKTADLQQRLQTIRSSLGADPGSLKVDTVNVKDEDWSEVWKQYYKPFRAGRRLVVKPTWESYAPAPGDLVIEMDPGMAFGSGTHETTGMCLALLEEAVRPGDSVVDVGTGSGILAIGAALLGADHVLAIDIDRDAVRVAKENIAHNGMTGRIESVEGNLLEKRDVRCDVCVANIIADVICMFAEPLLSHIRPGGLFICSGIIRERAQDVTGALTKAGYTILQTVHKGEWVAMLSRRPD